MTSAITFAVGFSSSGGLAIFGCDAPCFIACEQVGARAPARRQLRITHCGDALVASRLLRKVGRRCGKLSTVPWNCGSDYPPRLGGSMKSQRTKRSAKSLPVASSARCARAILIVTSRSLSGQKAPRCRMLRRLPVQMRLARAWPPDPKRCRNLQTRLPSLGCHLRLDAEHAAYGAASRYPDAR